MTNMQINSIENSLGRAQLLHQSSSMIKWIGKVKIYLIPYEIENFIIINFFFDWIAEGKSHIMH